MNVSAHSNIPLITFGAIEWLETNLGEDMHTFEWGSGGSTLYFSERVAKHVAVEHALSYYTAVSDRLKDKGIRNCEYLFVEAVLLEEMLCPRPRSHKSCNGCVYPGIMFASDRGSRSWRCYKDYVTAINQFTSVFDVIFIDGRARKACVYYAMDRVRPGGAIVLDNSRRKRYSAGCRLLEEWPRTDFCGKGPRFGKKYKGTGWCTTIWTKPLRVLSSAVNGGQDK